MPQQRLFSGIQPTGEVHIGNYLGAIQRWVQLAASRQYEAIYSVVDYHAMTVPYEPDALRTRTLDLATILMACGLNADNSILFIQSQVPEHTELAWILNCVCTMGDLSRMTQFKDKSRDKGESVMAGLLNYPILMAADVLLYKTMWVPVGEDQVQHLELSREIVRNFNTRFGETFPEPQPLLGEAKRILGIDGTAKMSKSLGNTIGLVETPQEIWKKLAPAKTDERRKKKSDPGVPTDCNIYTSYHRYFSSPQELQDIDQKCRHAAFGCLECKKILAKNIEAQLGPIRNRYDELKQKPAEISTFLTISAQKCRAMAQVTMEEVRKKIGVR